MRIRLLKNWSGQPAGSIQDWGGGVCDALVRRRFAEYVLEDVKAVVAPPENKAISQPQAHKRRR